MSVFYSVTGLIYLVLLSSIVFIAAEILADGKRNQRENQDRLKHFLR